MRSIMSVCFVTVAVLGIAPASFAELPTSVSFETLVDRSLADDISVPLSFWLTDGSLLLFDRRIPAADRTIEHFDPKSLKRSSACDATAALASVRQLLDDATVWPDGLPWPDQFSADGRRAVYRVAGDLFLLDLEHSQFSRLSRTPETEINPGFSPDGQYLAFVRANNIVVITFATGAEQVLTHDGSSTLLNGTLSWVYWEEVFGRRDTAYWWSPDSQAIAFLQTDQSGVDVSLQQEYEPETPRVIRQYYAKAGHTNPVVRVGVVTLGDAKTVWMNTGKPTPEWVVRVAWHPDSKRLAIQTMPRSQNRLDLLLADTSTGESSILLTEKSKTFVNVNEDLQFVDDGKKLLWPSERSGTYQYGLYSLDGKLIRWLDIGDLVVRASSGVFWVKAGICATDDAKRLVYFTATEGSPIAPALYRVNWDGGPAEKIATAAGTHRISFDDDAQFFLDELSTISTPSSLTLR
ncbi:MAG: DPP IV N-terminal domain-containing protein, partial [Acidobacteriota bacterium]|nr:DPP IV N-terminal domain-containing protein [Acidobacteriota bacterium]